MARFLLGSRCAYVRPELRAARAPASWRKQLWGMKPEAKVTESPELLEALILIPPAVPTSMILLFS